MNLLRTIVISLLLGLIAVPGRAEEPASEFSFTALLPPLVKQPGHCSFSYEWPAFIAGLYEQGDVLPKNLPKAVELYRIAASKSGVDPLNSAFTSLQYKLGVFYVDGGGVEQDDSEAYFWVGVAAARSMKYRGAAAALESKLTPEQVEAVKSRIVNFLTEHRTTSVGTICGAGTIDFVGELKALRPLAEHGDPLAQARLASDLIDAFDNEEGYFWATLALSSKKCQPLPCQGFSNTALNRIAGKLTSAQTANLNQRVKEWKPTPAN